VPSRRARRPPHWRPAARLQRDRELVPARSPARTHVLREPIESRMTRNDAAHLGTYALRSAIGAMAMTAMRVGAADRAASTQAGHQRQHSQPPLTLPSLRTHPHPVWVT
jgi:hypothetical protein